MNSIHLKKSTLVLSVVALVFGIFQNCKPVPFEVDSRCTDQTASISSSPESKSFSINYPQKSGETYLLGDMILGSESFSKNQISSADAANSGSSLRANPISNSYWPNKIVPIAVSIFGPSMSVYSNSDLLKFKDLVFATCRHYARFADIQCVERTNEPTYLDAKLAAANDVGAICGAGAMGCADYPDRAGARLYTVIEGHLTKNKFFHLHEMGHSLGLGHEFNNPALANLYEYPATGAIDLAKIPWNLWTSFGVHSVPYVTIQQNYDPGSVMNYAVPIALYGGRLKNQEAHGHMYFITNQFDKILGQFFSQDESLFLITQSDAEGVKAIYGSHPNSQKICRNPITNQIDYEAGTVAYFFPFDVADAPGETCTPEGRICENNGVLTGTATSAKCKIICKTADGHIVPFSENIKHGIKTSKLPGGGQKVDNPPILNVVYKKNSDNEYIEKRAYCDSAGTFMVFGTNNELEDESIDSEQFYLNTTTSANSTSSSSQNGQTSGGQPLNPCKK